MDKNPFDDILDDPAPQASAKGSQAVAEEPNPFDDIIPEGNPFDDILGDLPEDVKKSGFDITPDRILNSPLGKATKEVAMGGPVSPGMAELQMAPGRGVLSPYEKLAQNDQFKESGIVGVASKIPQEIMEKGVKAIPDQFHDLLKTAGEDFFNSILGYRDPGVNIMQSAVSPVADKPAYDAMQSGPVSAYTTIKQLMGKTKAETIGNSTGVKLAGQQLDLMASPNIIEAVQYPLKVRYRLANEVMNEVGKHAKANGAEIVVDENGLMRYAESKTPEQLKQDLVNVKERIRQAKTPKVGEETAITAPGNPEVTPQPIDIPGQTAKQPEQSIDTLLTQLENADTELANIQKAIKVNPEISGKKQDLENKSSAAVERTGGMVAQGKVDGKVKYGIKSEDGYFEVQAGFYDTQEDAEKALVAYRKKMLPTWDEFLTDRKYYLERNGLKENMSHQELVGEWQNQLDSAKRNGGYQFIESANSSEAEGDANPISKKMAETSKLEEIVKKGGGKFKGYQEPTVSKSGKTYGDFIYFDAPTGSTLVLKKSELTPENVADKIFKSNNSFLLGGSGITNEDVKDLFLHEEGDDPAVSILKSLKDDILNGEAGGRTFNDETGEIKGYGSTFPEYFKNKGYGKDEVVRAIDKWIAKKPITPRQFSILKDLVDGIIKQEIERAKYYDEQARLQETGGEVPQESSGPEEIQGHDAPGATSQPEIPAEAADPSGEVDTSFDFNLESEKPPAPKAQEPDLFGGEKSYRKPEFGEARELPAQKEEATPLHEKANEEKQQKIKNEGFGGRSSGKSSAKSEDFSSEKGSSSKQQAETSDSDLKASLGKKMGGLEYVQAIESPELLKLAKEFSGKDVKLNDRLISALGRFMHIDGPGGKSWIELSRRIFKDPKLMQGVLAHEIGHLIDWLPDESLKRGNILGRMASLMDYHKTLLPREPGENTMLTDKDRARIRREAEKLAADIKGGQKNFEFEPENQFDPDLVIGIWNSVEQSGIPKPLLDYVKGLDAAGKKRIIRAAMEAKKAGQTVTIEEVGKLNREYKANPESVYEIYKDLLKKEILKRKLFEEEVINGELKALTKWWHPFDEAAETNPLTGEKSSYLKYRYSSKELYAEFVSVLLNAPGKAKEIAPKAYEAFFNYLGEKPEVYDNLLKVQALVQGGNDDLFRVREADIKGMFRKGEEAYRARQIRYQQARRSPWFFVKNAIWDKNTAILETVGEIAKKNPLIQKSAISNTLERRDFISSVIRSYLEKVTPIHQEIMKSKLRDDVGVFMFAKRISGDRSEYANPLAQNPKTAEDQLEFLKRNNPQRYAKVEGLVADIQKWMKDTINPLMVDVYKPGQMTLIESNDTYAPFRVVDFMKDYVSAGIIQQVGTLRDIGNPYDSLLLKSVSMVRAAAKNDAVKRLGNFIIQHPAEFRAQTARITEYPGVFKIENPPDPTLGTIAWRERGEWRAMHVDKYIAEAVNGTDHNSIEFIQRTGEFLDKLFLNNAVFRPLWITFNITFQAANFLRDFGATWKANPKLTLPNVLKSYVKAFPHAVARVKNELDPVINEMYKHGALNITYNDLILGQTDEDLEIERLLAQYDLSEVKGQKFKNLPVIKQAVGVLDAIRFVGDIIETLPKVAAWEGLSSLPAAERSRVVRNFVGTPNFKRKGSLTPITNSIFLFSNIQKEGIRRMIELGTSKDTRGNYWRKTAAGNLFPKVVMLLAAAGIFGPKVKELMDKQTEYKKTNYTVIPIGEIDKKSIALTIPQDEEGKLISGLFWKIANAAIKDGSLNLKDLQDVFSFAGGQAPSLAPGIAIAKNWAEFLSGRSPRDDYRGYDIVPEENMKAGGWYAFRPMVFWTVNQTGLSRLSIFDSPKDQPFYEKAISIAPIAQRFISISDYGEAEGYRGIAETVGRQESLERIEIKEGLKRGEDITPKTQGQKRMIENFKRKHSTRQASDPVRNVLLTAGSVRQKLAVLHEAQKKFSSKNEFTNYVRELAKARVISVPVAKQALREWSGN